jgi:hypothetical protein
MANTLQLKNDIKKLKTALASKGLSASIKNKLKGKLEKAEKDLKSAAAPRKTTTTKSQLANLKELVKKKKYGIYKKSGVDLKKDSEEPALPIGRRVSKGLKGNQYGNKKSSKGNVYYEYRANRLDVKQPSKTAKYPKLADGGEIDDDYRYELNDYILEKFYTPQNKKISGFKLIDPEEGETPFIWKKGNIEITAVPSYEVDDNISLQVFKNSDEPISQQEYIPFPKKGDLEKDAEQYVEILKPYFVKYSGKMEDGGMMAYGGKLSKKDFFKKYEENEDENMHTENVVLLAENYGTESDIRDAKTILAKHESIGHLPTSLRLERDALHDKLYAKYVQSREDGGMMAEGGENINQFQKYVQDGSKIAFAGGGNGTNITDYGLLEVAMYIDQKQYSIETRNLFKKLVISMVNDEIENNQVGANDYKKGGMMAEGGVTEKEVVDSNAQMVLSNVKEVKHHADELSKVVTKKSNIEAWVVAKIERASTDLSDITHYLEGQNDKMSMGGSVYNHLHKMDKK